MQFQFAITYTLGIISTLIFMSCIWSTCSLIARDIDSYKIHMIISKNVHRGSFWMGRFFGTSIAYLMILAISSLAFYCTLKLIPEIKSYTPMELSSLKQNIFTAQKSYLSEQKNLSQEIEKEVEEKLQIAKKENQPLSNDEISVLRRRTYYSILSKRGEIKPDTSKEFDFELSKSLYKDGAFLTFTPYVGAIDVLEKQKRDTVKGVWFIRTNNKDYAKIEGSPERLISNEKYTIKLPEIPLNQSINNVSLKFTNMSNSTSVFFRLTETPAITVSFCPFFLNYLRLVFIMVLGVILMSAIGCALGGFLSFPIAIFVVIFYLIFGTLSSYILSNAELYRSTKDLDMKIGYSLSKTLIKVVSPMQSFQPTDEISSGMLIESSTMYEIIIKYFVFQLLVFAFCGVYLFSRREFGMVIKK